MIGWPILCRLTWWVQIKSACRRVHSLHSLQRNLSWNDEIVFTVSASAYSSSFLHTTTHCEESGHIVLPCTLMNGFVSTSACGKQSFWGLTSQHSTGTPENLLSYESIWPYRLILIFSFLQLRRNQPFSNAHESLFSQDLVTGHNRYEHAGPVLWRDRCWGWAWRTNGGGSQGVFWILQHRFTPQIMTVWAGLTAALLSCCRSEAGEEATP